MKRIFITLMLALSFLGLQAQTKTTYYKSSKFEKVVPRSEANYKIVWSLNKDTLENRAYKIRGNQFVFNYKFLNDKPVGIWYYYGKKGNLIYQKNFNELVYSDAPVKNMHSYDKNKCDPNDKHYKQPIFRGGNQGLWWYILNRIYYPGIETESLHHTGTVVIRFYVDTNGKAVPYSIVKGVDSFIDLEAWQIIKEMPNWIPAKLNGRPIRAMVNLHLDFHPGVGLRKTTPSGPYPFPHTSPRTSHSQGFRN